MTASSCALAVAALLASILPPPPAAFASDCADTTKGFTPLNDLGAGFYKGEQGGLYSGGTNVRPAAHDAAGLAIASAIGPLDTLGNPNILGKVVLISIGMSNATQEFSVFVDTANADPLKKPNVLVIDAAIGGQEACQTADPGDDYWVNAATKIRAAGSTPAQVQVIWMKQTCATGNLAACFVDSFPCGADLIRAKLASVVRNAKDVFPNAKLLFATSRIYAGYATTNLSPEPWAYESGFSVKWLIEDQVNGEDSLNYDPGQGAVEAPWIAWGPYLWADGLIPRSDGLTWSCADFNPTDGTHPGPAARMKVASQLKQFFHTDPAATPWYLLQPTGSDPAIVGPRGVALTASPNPFRDAVRIDLELDGRASVPRSLAIYDATGRRVRSLLGAGGIAPAGFRSDGSHPFVWDGTGDDGRRVSPGVYLIRLETSSGVASRTLTLVR